MTEIISKIGLELVLEGLGQFGRNMQEATNLVNQFSKGGEDMERTFKPVNKLLSAFFESLKRIGEFVVAGLIIRGFEKITSTIRDMVGAMITAGIEFQTLTIRLEGLLAREILDAGQVSNFTEALELAGPAAEDLFFWIQQLALTTPFDIQDVAETITFAKAYGFAADQAKIVTSAIIDFASGMGLTSVQMKRIIENFGQMIQQGKVTNTELRDLGRGALVPINKILERMRENLGLTNEAFIDLRKEGGLQVTDFINAFIQVVGEDFPDAGRRASRTIKAIVGNMKDLIEGILGFNVIKPILDVVAEKFAAMLDALTTGDRGDKLIELSQKIGESLAGIVSDFIGGAPGGETIADLILDKFGDIAKSIEMFRELLTGIREGRVSFPEGVRGTLMALGFPEDFIQQVDVITIKIAEIGEKIKNAFGFLKDEGLVNLLLEFFPPGTPVGNFIKDIQTALENIQIFWAQNKEQILGIIDSLIGSFLKTGEVGGETLLEILGNQLVRFSDILVEDGPKVLDFIETLAESFRSDLLPRLIDLADWVIRNQDTVTNFFIAMGILKEIAPAALILGAALAALNAPLSLFLGGLFILQNLDAFGTLFRLLQQLWQIITLTGQILWAGAVDTFNRAVSEIRNIGAGLVHEMWMIGWNAVKSFADSFGRMWDWFVGNVTILWNNFIGWLRHLLGIGSPSKVFETMGRQTIEGYAKGIMEGFRMPEDAMRAAISQTLSPAIHAMMPAMNGASVSTTNNFALNVNSSARTEPVIADFRMLQSLVTR